METSLLAVIGNNVKKYRDQAGLTQAELAEQVGVGTAFVSRVERGQKRMRLETMLAFADALHISAGLLFYEENRDAQLQTLVKMLEGQPPEFLDGVIALVRVCVENFENRKTDPAQI